MIGRRYTIVCPGCHRRRETPFVFPRLRCACGYEGKAPGVIGRTYTIGGGADMWTVIARGGPPFNVGGPSGNVLLEHFDDGRRIVRPFRGLRRVVPAGRRKAVKSA